MAVSDATQWVLQWVINPLFWFLLVIVFILGTIGILWYRKKKRLQFPTIELVDLGNGKTAINNLRSGWFGKKLYLKGLWWTGEEVLRIKSGEIIEDFSTEDYQEVDGERGVVCYRNPVDQNILVPISQTKFLNKELVAEIAPASYRDVAVDIVKDAIAETTEWRDKILQFISWALVVVFSLIAIVVITQMVKSGQTEAKDLILKAGETCLEAGKNVCSQIASTLRTTQAP